MEIDYYITTPRTMPTGAGDVVLYSTRDPNRPLQSGERNTRRLAGWYQTDVASTLKLQVWSGTAWITYNGPALAGVAYDPSAFVSFDVPRIPGDIQIIATLAGGPVVWNTPGYVRLSVQSTVVNQGGSLGSTPLGALLDHSATILGPDFGYNFDHLMQNTIVGWTIAGPSPVVDPTHGPGVFSCVNTNLTIGFKTACVVKNPQVTPWYLAGRFKIATAPGAGEVKVVSLDTNAANGYLRIGLQGPISTTKFVFAVATAAGVVTSALSSVSLDITNFHVLRMWFDGSNVWGSVDGETPVLVAAAAACPNVGVFERWGTIAAAGAVLGAYFDWLYAAAQGTST